ncbi:MAG TPA: glycosyl transferase group 1 [Cyanobacteria bacterium UBA8156]|jgi:glycosyltransferase involved in cell wall biosynthesis|nr:glycosyl transferase group 1 [Cyanobacteria bacterium UBA8156]
MQVLHVPYIFHPDPVGGTEVYVQNLIRALQTLGWQGAIAAPGKTTHHYLWQDLPVYRYGLNPNPNPSEIYGPGDAVSLPAWRDILQTVQPAIVHFHALTSGVSLRHLQAAKALGLPVVFTYHTPTVSCQRGTLLRWGQEICGGNLAVSPCGPCALQGLGVPQPLAQVLGRLPGTLTQRWPDRRGLWTALKFGGLVTQRQQVFYDVMAEATAIVAVCRWVQDLLIANGVPPQKITLCRQGTQADAVDQPAAPHPAALRVACLGRFDPVKGMGVLIAAWQAMPHARIALDLYGVGNPDYGAKLRAMAANDPRITFREPVAAEQVVPTLQQYDLLAVPSQCLETGPLVVYEAFAAGVPVVGSDLGGMAELVVSGVDGRLVRPHDDPLAWARVFQELTANPESLQRWRSGVQSPRTMDEVAIEMVALYGSLLA